MAGGWKTMLLFLAVLGRAEAAQELTVEERPGVVYEGGEGPGQGKHVVLVAGDEEYRSEEALPLLAQILSVHHGFRCTVLFATDPVTGEIDPDQQGHVPGLEVLEDADMLVLFLRFRHLPDEDMRHIVEYVEAGRPLLGIRTATHAFAYPGDSASSYAHWGWNSTEWPGGFGRQVLGETWVNHHGRHGQESTRGVIVEEHAGHPILRGVRDVWGPTDVYGIRELPADATVLLEGSVLASMEPDSSPVTDGRNDPRMPLIWIRERQLESGAEQRVVCSTIGASIDLESEGLCRILVNSVYWAARLEERVPDESRVSPPRPFAPSMFGFGGARGGVRPLDHALPTTGGDSGGEQPR